MTARVRIIDNKKISLTNEEWDMYQKICRSYDAPNRKGEDFFVDLFESDNAGLITILKPPSKRSCSMEIFLFLMTIVQQQQLREMHKQIDDVCQQMKDKLKTL